MAADSNSRLVYSTGDPVPDRPREKKHRTQAAPPSGGGVRLRLDRRASDRVVTTISGLRGSERELEALLQELKGASGSGGTLKHGVVELQGDQRDKVARLLSARGIQSKRAGG
jgi:translation initiation factor 1